MSFHDVYGMSDCAAYPNREILKDMMSLASSSWSLTRLLSKSVFGSVIVGIFQITFRAKIHVNDVFHFLKIIFDISTSKRTNHVKF